MTDTSSPNYLITGAAGGLGRALGVACAQRGARVILLDSNLRGLEAACDAVEAAGGPAPGYCQVDLASLVPDQAEELIGALRGSYGELDALVHCAARFRGLQPIDQVPGDEWLASLQVNLNAAWLLSSLCLPSLKSGPGGALVFVLDTVRAMGSAYWGPYGVSKAAAHEMAAMFASELEGTSVRVLGVSPGPMRTSLRATAFHAEDPTRVPEPKAVADDLARWLAGEGETGGLQRLV